MQKILNFQNAKTSKGEKRMVKTGVIYLAPNTIAGPNICPSATERCIEACLYTSGRGAFTSIQTARIAKTKSYHADKQGFINRLEKEIASAYKSSQKKGFQLAIRINGTSDLPVETWGLMEKFPDVAFYDYTKVQSRMAKFLEGKMPANYHLTFSLSENNLTQALAFLSLGGNVAVVFRKGIKEAFPEKHWGFPVVSGDDDDLRYLDPKGVIVGLRTKGKARKAVASGFIQEFERPLALAA
jgi:hypothetical protein